MFVLLRGVELEGLQTDGNADLGVGVHHSGVRLDTVPVGREKRLLVISIRTKSLTLPLGGCGLYFETNFLVGRVF